MTDEPAPDPPADASPEERLRYRAASALERGLAFIDAHGDALARVRARVLLGAAPRQDCVAPIEERLAPDGSLPPLGVARQGAAGLRDFLDGTPPPEWLGLAEALVVLSDAGALGTPVVEVIAGTLRATQREDGGWGDSRLDEGEQIFVTGLLAGYLGRTRVVRPDVLERAGRFLAERWSPERVAGRNWPALAGFGSWYSSTGDDLADEALQWIGRELERGHRQGLHDAVHTVRVLLHCDASSVPGSALVPAALLEALLAEQGEDGGFDELAEGSDATRVTPTFDAMLGTIRLCGVI